ncbi:hypothetical protein [Sphingomonas sp.]|uniref:hypothetical protein n=1 Tax=Sphingomonas sp. TaxID=28214 RepID=UPI0031DF3F1E
MSETRSFDQVQKLAAVSPDAQILVSEPGGVEGVIDLKVLFGKFIATDTATATVADLNGQLGYPDKSIGLVFADPDLLKNGWYRKAGAKDAGAWVQFETLSKATRESMLTLSGNGPPAAAFGLAGQFYRDLLNGTEYGPKTANGWGQPRSLVGPPGAANSTFPTWAALKAAPVSNRSYNFAPDDTDTSGKPAAIYFFRSGDFTGKIDDVSRVALNDVPIATGALVRQGAEGLDFSIGGSSAALISMRDKGRQVPSIVDFEGVVGDGGTDCTAGIQRAINWVGDRGGGSLLVPRAVFLVTRALNLCSNIDLYGNGFGSAIHLVNNDRLDLFRAIGTQAAPLSNIRLRNMRLYGDARFINGTPVDGNGNLLVNGGGLNAVFADDCEVDGLWVSGFSDGGLAFLNGNFNRMTNNRVRYTGQGISFNANEIDVTGNVASANRISDTGTYNGLHLEGSFGDGTGEGKVYDTVLSDNIVVNSYECGKNIENAPNTVLTGGSAVNSGYGGTGIDMGIKVFGSPGSTIGPVGIRGAHGWGLIVGAGSSNCNVTGITTKACLAGDILFTDSAIEGGEPIAASEDHALSSSNSLGGRKIKFSGNANLRPRQTVFKGAIYEEVQRTDGANGQQIIRDAVGNIVWRRGFGINAPDNSMPLQDFRESVGVTLEQTLAGWVKPRMTTAADDNAAAAAGVDVGALYRTSDGLVRVRLA